MKESEKVKHIYIPIHIYTYIYTYIFTYFIFLFLPFYFFISFFLFFFSGPQLQHMEMTRLRVNHILKNVQQAKRTFAVSRYLVCSALTIFTLWQRSYSGERNDAGKWEFVNWVESCLLLHLRLARCLHLPEA